MSEYIVGNAYEQTVRRTAQNLMPWARMAEVSSDVTKGDRGSVVVFPVSIAPETTDETALSLGQAADTPLTNDDRDVPVTLQILGKSYQVYDGVASLQETVADRALNSKIKDMATIAANTIDAKAYAAISALPITGTLTFTHPAGPDTGGTNWLDPIAAGLLHIGPDATSLSDAAELAADDKITAAILRQKVQHLVNKNVQPVGYLEAGDLNSFLYRAVLTDKQMLDLRAEVGENTIVSTNKYMAWDKRVMAGTFMVWENLILLTSTRAKDVISPEEGDDFYAHRAVISGMNYLGMGASPAEELPASATDIERIVMFGELDGSDAMNPQGSQTPIPRIFEIRKVPSYDAQGRLSKISWLSHCGFRQILPTNGIQLVTRASNDPAIV
jgi:hypothetical protein